MRKFFSATLILALTVCSFLLSLWTPWGLDDWTFVAEWRDVVGESFSLSSLYSFWADIRLYDNGRFSNTLIPVFLLYSPWKELFPIITGIAVGLIVYLISLFSFRKDNASVFSLGIVWLSVIFLLPWRSGLFIADYSINYIWTAAITLLFMGYVMKYEKRGWNSIKTIFAIMLAFIAGGWHEGFALPTTAGMFLYTIKSNRKFSLQWWIIGVFYAGIAIANYLCPGMLERTANEWGTQRQEFSLIKTLLDFLPIVLLIFISAFLSLTREGRNRLANAWNDPWFVISAGIVAIGTALSLIFVHQSRSAFWPDIMAVVMILILTGPIWRKIYDSSFKLYVEILVIAIAFLPMIFAISEQYEYFKEAKQIEKMMLGSSTGTVFYDARESDISTLLALKIPTHALWKTAYQYEAIQNFTNKPTAAVVPGELGLKGWKSNAKIIPGNAGISQVGSSLILSCDENGIASHVVYPDITLKNGEEVKGIALYLPYITTEGERYIYIKVLNVPLEEISEIGLPDY